MPKTEIQCPSGLVVVVREFRVSDEDILANRQTQRRGTSQTELLRAIVERVEEPGPYVGGDGDHGINWSRVLHGDRMVVFKENRIETLGNVYPVDKPCKSALCDETVHIDIDLNDLKIKKLPESSMAHAVDPKIPLRVVLPDCGARFGFKLLRGRDDQAMGRLKKQNKKTLSSAILRYQTMGIHTPAPEGTKITEAKDKWVAVSEPDWKKWIRNMSMGDASFLRAAMQRADCGVEQSHEFYCEDCGLTWEEDVQFTSDFLFPKHQESNSTVT